MLKNVKPGYAEVWRDIDGVPTYVGKVEAFTPGYYLPYDKTGRVITQIYDTRKQAIAFVLAHSAKESNNTEVIRGRLNGCYRDD